METKNKFDTFDELDDFDKMLFEHYKNQDENIPLSTENAIKNAFNDKHKSNSTALIMFKKVAMFILAIGIITTTTVYAKDIVNFIANIFTNSNRGIDKAVDNGYIQNVDMDYIICNNVGVKVDYLLMDDKNLDISFVYHYLGEITNIQNISASELTIKDEKNNILCLKSNEDLITTNNIFGNEVCYDYNQQFIDNNTIKNSIIVTSKQFPNSKKLYIEIRKLALTLNNEIKYINGNWIFSISLNNNLVERISNEYTSSQCPYVNQIKTSLTNTSLSIELNLNTLFDEKTLYNRNSINLKDINGNTYKQSKMLSYNYEHYSTITVVYPISIYDNIEKLFLHIDLDLNKQIDIELTM